MPLLRIAQLGDATVFGFLQLFKSIKHEFWLFPDPLNVLSSGSYQRLLSYGSSSPGAVPQFYLYRPWYGWFKVICVLCGKKAVLVFFNIF